MTLQEYIDKAGCCAGQMAYEAIIDEQDGKDCYVKKQHKARILLLIRDALLCVQNGGDCLTEKQTQLLYERIQQMCGCCCAEFVDIDNSVPVPCDVTTLDAGLFSCIAETPNPPYPLYPYIMVLDYSGKYAYRTYYYTYEYSDDQITWSIIPLANTWIYHFPSELIYHQYYRVTSFCFQDSTTFFSKIIEREDLVNIPFKQSIYYKVGNGSLTNLQSAPYEMWFPYNLILSIYEFTTPLKMEIIPITDPIPVPFPTGLITSLFIDETWFAGFADYEIIATFVLKDSSNYIVDVNVCATLPVDVSLNVIPKPEIGSSYDFCYGDVPQTLTCVYGTNLGMLYETYQWYQDGAIMAGENSDILQVSESGDYNCIVTKKGFTITSDVITLTEKSQLPLPVIDIDDALALANGINPESYWRISDSQAYIHDDISPYYTSVDYGTECEDSTYLSEQSGITLSADFEWINWTPPTTGQNYLFVNTVFTYLLNYSLLGCTSGNSNGYELIDIDLIDSPIYFKYNSVLGGGVVGYSDTPIIRNGLLTSCDGIGVLTATTYNTNIVWMQLDPVTLAMSVVQVGGASFTATGSGIYIRYGESTLGETDYHGFFIK